MASTLQAEEDKKVSAASSEIRGAKLTYKVESLVPGGMPTEMSYAPNQTIIDKFKEMRANQAGASKEVIDAAIKFNRGPERSGSTAEESLKKSLLVPGLFPDPVPLADAVPEVDSATFIPRDDWGDGTVAPYAAGCAVMFEPTAAVAGATVIRIMDGKCVVQEILSKFRSSD